MILVCLASIFASVRFCFIPAARQYIRVRELSTEQAALVKRCMDHTYPAGTVVFDEHRDDIELPEDWAEAYLLTRRPVAHGGVKCDDAKAIAPYFWRWNPSENMMSPFNGLNRISAELQRRVVCAYGMRPVKMYGIEGWADEVYSHSRRCAGGKERLIIIGFDSPAFAYGSDAPFKALVVTPATLLHSLDMKWSDDAFGFKFTCPPEQMLRLYTGVSDDADPSHFTIDYETSAGRGTIEGWLKADDTVNLKVTQKPLANPIARPANSQFVPKPSDASLFN